MSSINIKSIFIIISIFIVCLLSGCNNTDDKPVIAPPDENETASQTFSDTTTSLPDGIAYIFENGDIITIDAILSPVINYNSLSLTGNATLFSKIYPDDVLSFIIKNSPYETADEYSLSIKELYKNAYGDTFNMNNEFISCRLLSDDELINFVDFYKINLNSEISPNYAFVVESDFTITYTDEAGIEQSDSESDYYIAYMHNGIMYLDYLFLDTLDL